MSSCTKRGMLVKDRMLSIEDHAGDVVHFKAYPNFVEIMLSEPVNLSRIQAAQLKEYLEKFLGEGQ